MQNAGYNNISRMGSMAGGESFDTKLTQHNLDLSINEEHVFDAIGDQGHHERQEQPG
jgi:hypothetical protein